MKIDVTQIIVDVEGRPKQVVVAFDEEKKPILALATLRRIAADAMLAVLDGDQSSRYEEKLKRDQLARLIHANDEVDLSAEDIAFIKARIDRAYPAPDIVAGAYRLIDPRPAPAPDTAVA